MITDTYDETDEHPCEQLVRIIQSREGTPSKEERERAFEELLDMFRPLIRSIAWKVYRGFRHVLFTDFASFYHDTVTTVIELVLADYIPKKYGGKSMFAPYLQTKLYYRTLYRAQKALRQHEREFSSPLQYEQNMMNDVDRSTNIMIRETWEASITGQIGSALLSQASNVAESVFESFSHHQLEKRIRQLTEIAKQNLTEQEHFVWHSTLFSGMKMNEIASVLNQNLEPEEKPWTKQRVYNSYHKIRIKVLSAFGEAALAGEV